MGWEQWGEGILQVESMGLEKHKLREAGFWVEFNHEVSESDELKAIWRNI